MNLSGKVPEPGMEAPDFTATRSNLTDISLHTLGNRKIIINVFPSIDTCVCFDSVKALEKIGKERNITVLCLSMDSPFALKRAEEGERLGHVILLSDIRNREFGEKFGVTIVDGPLAGFLARSVFLIDKNHRILYSEVAHNISKPLDIEKIVALAME